MNTRIEPFVRYIAKSTKYIADRFVVANDCRLFYILSGNVSIETDGGTYSLMAGSLLYCPCGHPYKLSSDEGSELLFYTVNFDFSRKYTDVLPMVPQDYNGHTPVALLRTQDEADAAVFDAPLCLPAAEWCEEMLNGIYEEMLRKNEGCEAVQGALLRVILIHLFRKRQSVQATSLSRRIKALLQRDICLNNREIAAQLNYHPFYLNTVFKHETGESLHQYAMKQRLARAHGLIVSTQQSLAEIAQQCGFSSQAHLSCAFTKHFGITPARLRRLL